MIVYMEFTTRPKEHSRAPARKMYFAGSDQKSILRGTHNGMRYAMSDLDDEHREVSESEMRQIATGFKRSDVVDMAIRELTENHGKVNCVYLGFKNLDTPVLTDAETLEQGENLRLVG